MTTRALLLLTAFAFGCSEPATTPEPVADAGPSCDPARCAANNVCAGGRCRLQCRRHTDCPAGYDCRTVDGQNVCLENGMPTGEKTFGAGCGLNGDADCDATQAFVCIGPRDDPDAYCTRAYCETDADCPGNYYCTEHDVSGGGTRRVCLKRGFCAPAEAPRDCLDEDAVFMRDPEGFGYCARACAAHLGSLCGSGNECKRFEDFDACVPRAGSCRPTREFCSRCVSSADCPAGGFCVTVPFTNERYCTQPCSTARPCPQSAGGVESACKDTTFGDFQCLPVYLGTGMPPSCWPPL